MPIGYLRVINLDTGQEVGALPHATKVKWLDDLYDKGSGSCQLPLDAPELQDTPGLIQGRNAVQVLIDGVPRFAWRMRSVKLSEADPNMLELDGPGVRDMGQWGLVYPERGLDWPLVPDRRLFGFQALAYDPAANGWNTPAPYSFGGERTTLNEIQNVRLYADPGPFAWGSDYPSPGGLTGTWTLTHEGNTTAAIQWDASNADVKAALEALASIDTVNVTGSTFEGLSVEFIGSMAGQTTSLLDMGAHDDLRHTHVEPYVERAQEGGGYDAGAGEFVGYAGAPEGWPDPDAEWIAPQAPTDEGGGVIEHPEGWWFARRVIVMDDAPGPSLLAITADDRFVAWWNGELVAEGNNWREFETVELGDVPAGEHVLAVAVYNSGAANGSNPTALRASVMHLDDTTSDGYGNVWARTFTPAVYGGTGRAGPWYTLRIGSPRPGMTAGEVLRTVVEEAQARGALEAVQLGGFSDATDSAGQAWPVSEYAFQVGNDNLESVLNRLSDFGVDAQLGPDLTLEAWVAPKGTDRTNVVLPAAPVAGGWERDLDTYDTVLLRTEDGWTERPVAPPVVRHEAFVSMGLTPDAGSAAVVADRFAAEYSQPRDSAELTYSPATGGVGPDLPQPYDELQLGDELQVVNTLDGALSVGRLQSIGGELDDESGEPSWTLELLL